MHKPLVAAGLTALTLGVSACGGGGSGTSTPSGPSPYATGPVAPAPTVPPTNFIIDVAEINGPYSFYPSPATARAGQVIVWRNSDSVKHHVVFDDMSVDAGTLAPGTLSQPIMVAPGNWAYHCAIHPSMVGSLTVGASTGTAPVPGSY